MAESSRIADWRQFERLVARIEKAMAPSGAVVRSPDRLLDKDTGHAREVDASIRYSVGTLPVLITIECRDRSSVEDVTWIEQVAQKRDSVGAAITVAVSSAGFSAPALAKAAQLAIFTRTLTEATADDLLSWLRTQSITFDFEQYWMRHVRLTLYDAPETWSFDDHAAALVTRLGSRAPVIIRHSDKAAGSMDQILQIWKEMNDSVFPRDVPPDGLPHYARIRQLVERGTLYVNTTEGPRDIAAFEIILGLVRTERDISVARLAEYADHTGPLVQSAEWDISEQMMLSLHRDMRSGKTRIVVSGAPQQRMPPSARPAHQ